SNCFTGEQEQTKHIACESRVDVNDVRSVNLNDDCDQSSSSSLHSHKNNSNRLIDRIFPSIIVDSSFKQQPSALIKK
ncbi:hypothetical protein PGTUg99_019576, partial [Puccinia graminis f. sp. tritici]